MQPMQAIEFLRSVFIPRFRTGVADLKVLEQQELPELAEQTRALAQSQLNVFNQISPLQFPYEMRADAGRLKLEYVQDSQKAVEDVTAAITYFVAYMPSLYGNVPGISWGPLVSTFKAPADEMNNKVRIFKIITDSRKDNPIRVASCTQLTALVAREQFRQQGAILNRMRQISRTRSETSDIIMEVYEKKNQADDRIFDSYSQAIRGVDAYHDPINDWRVEFPTGYDSAWTNCIDYVFSESPSFNPNIGSTQNWERMQRQR